MTSTALVVSIIPLLGSLAIAAQQPGAQRGGAAPAAAPMQTKNILRWTIFIGATAFVVYSCLLILNPFINVIAWASVLAITFHPLHATSAGN